MRLAALLAGLGAFVLSGASRPGAGERLPPPGTSLDSVLRAGEVRTYSIHLRRGEFVHAVVDQRGTDVVVSFLGPAGELLVERDQPNGRLGPEPISLVAPRTGEYRLRIAQEPHDPVAGAFELRTTARRWPDARDLKRAAAEHVFQKNDSVASWTGSGDEKKRALIAGGAALALWAELGDGFERACTELRVADLHQSLGRGREAVEAYATALRLAKGLHEPRLEARMLRALAFGLFTAGDSRRASEVLRESARLAHESGETQVEASALQLLGWTSWTLGEYQEALESSGRAVDLAKAAGDGMVEAFARNALGLTCAKLGSDQEGLDLCRQAAEMQRSRGLSSFEATALNSVGWILFRAGRLDSAAETLQRVLALKRAAGDRPGEALALISLANVNVERGDLEAARSGYRRALALSRSSGDRERQVLAHQGLGNAFLKDGDGARAADELARALGLRRTLGERAGESECLVLLAMAERRRGRLDAARSAIESALGTIESIRVHFTQSDLRTSYTASHQQAFAFYVGLLMELHERDPSAGFDRLAFEASERGRARALLEDLAAADVEPKPARTATLPEVQGALGPDAALVSYALDGETIFVFVVGHDFFHASRLPAGVDATTPRVENDVDLLAGEESGAAAGISARLHRDLVDAWRARLPDTVRRIVIEPDGFLHRLPFETLTAGRGASALVHDFTISYAPSASLLVRLAAPPAPAPGRRDVLFVGDPVLGPGSGSALYEREGFALQPLPFARVEAKEVGRFGGSSSLFLVGEQASKAAVLSASPGRFRVLHFATHGIAGGAAAFSALALTPEPGHPASGFLWASEITRLKLDSDLVVLSACRTAHGRILAGEGVEGLARAFLHAGARSVVASLWDVNDRWTARFMAKFYRELAGGRGKAEALRRAKLDLLAAGAPPRAWAPFILVGEGDEPVELGRPWWRRLAQAAFEPRRSVP